jgi:hypothetical protein
MKMKSSQVGLVVLGSLLLAPGSLLAQGPLTPPGAPAPLFKTLTQVEPRTPISAAPFIITNAGSYYLTTNLTATSNGITISTNNVTLDLNGFTISSTASPASGTAVILNGVRQNITIRNGHIRGTTTYGGGVFTNGGFLDGVTQVSASSANIRISDLSVIGMGDDGINLLVTSTPTFVVERCTVAVCAGIGIFAGTIRDCSADTTGDSAIVGDIVVNCSGETVNTANPGASGIAGASVVDNCRGTALTGFGVQGIITVSNSRGTSTDGIGLSATTASHCYGSSSTGTGLSASMATSCFGISSTGAAGIDADPGTASYCRGSRNGGTAVAAGIAIGCTVSGTGVVTSLNKFLGTP